MRYLCWLKDDHLETDGEHFEARDPSEAAQDACERWNDRGAWGGEEFPNVIDVYVRSVDTRELFTVEVAPSWDVSFFASDAKAAAEPE